jgi:trimeric autotransporter adhesin
MKNITTLLKNICVLIIGLTTVIAQNNVGWQPLGPVEYPVNNIGQINGIARVSQIKFHPSDPKTMYAVTSMGGLFISKDEGNNWSPMGTDFIPQARNASVCIDYTDDRILYFSTGDPHYYSQYSGIWKSTNGGKNWTQSNSGIGNRMAVEMLMSPLDHNVIIAATNDGIWKTTNGGASWAVKKSGGNFTDMVFKPVANSGTIYAISHTEFWVSNDMGESWTRTTISGSGVERGGRVASFTSPL